MKADANLNLLRLSIADKLCAIEDLLPAGYRLTLVCRHTLNDEAHIILSVDDLRKAVAAIGKLEPSATKGE